MQTNSASGQQGRASRMMRVLGYCLLATSFALWLFSNPSAKFLLASGGVLALVVILHEFGHFFPAKIFGVKILRFSVFFGKPLLKKKIGETDYTVGWIPLGGYVLPAEGAGLSEKQLASLPPAQREQILGSKGRWLSDAKPWKQLLIAAGGPIKNLIWAFLALVALYAFIGIPMVVQPEPQPRSAESSVIHVPHRNEIPVLMYTVKESEAQDSGRWPFLSQTLPDVQLPQAEDLQLKPVLQGQQSQIRYHKLGLVDAASVSAQMVVNYIGMSFEYFGSMVGGLFSSSASESSSTSGSGTGASADGSSESGLSGPIGIIRSGAEISSQGLYGILFFFALLNMALAVMNLLPLPVLDGGRIIYASIEMLGVKVPAKLRRVIDTGGALLLLSIFLIATLGDLGLL